MNQSPLKFAREFEKLKSKVRTLGASDLSIFEMMDFWIRMYEYHDQKSYQSFYNEYASILLHIINNTSLSDFKIEELNSIRDILSELKSLKVDADQLQTKNRIVAIRLASINFYVGQIKEGLKIITDLTGAKLPDRLDFDETEGVDEFESFKRVCERFKDKDERLYAVLKEIVEKWEGEREYLSHDSINCLFVEKDGQGKSRRGRLRKLVGSVEATRNKARDDRVTFENQPKSPDDPFVGAGYDSLKAVRKVMGRNLLRKHARLYYHAYLNIKDSKETFTGDSIGLAIGLLAYVQLLKDETMRQRRLLPSDIAITGGVDEHGKITPVNEETLPAKIERAFFSPIKYLVLPQANYKSARAHLDKLQTNYPNRRLILIGSDRLSEVFCNLNIVREQKVCLGEYTVRTVYKYTRMAKVQVPLLVILIYFLVCQIYPKAWIGFDWNPADLVIKSNSYIIVNDDLKGLWKIKFEDESLNLDTAFFKLSNLDKDDKMELAIMPFATGLPADTLVSDTIVGNLYVFDDDGKLLFRKSGVIPNQYPNDDNYKQFYEPGDLQIFKIENQTIIVTIVTRSFPARAHIRFWSNSGDSLGWYINAGSCKFELCEDVNGDSINDIVFAGYNNRISCGVAFILPQNNWQGVSPPYQDPDYNLKWIKPGNQLAYIAFPPTKINKMSTDAYNHVAYVRRDYSSIYKIKTIEKTLESKMYCGVIYYLNSSFRVFKVSSDDYFDKLHRQAIDSSLVDDIANSEYYMQLRDSVRYWLGNDWISEGQLRDSEIK